MSSILQVPRHLDDPRMVLLWTSDDVAPIFFGVLAGVVLGGMLTFVVCTVAGFAMVYALRRFRNQRPQGYFKHMLWWYGLIPFGLLGKQSARALNPFERRVLPQ